MRRTTGICALALAALLLFGGCAQQGGRMDYIGAQAAKTLALEAAGVSAAQAQFEAVDMDSRDGLDYYTIAFQAPDGQYTYSIDALTGTVIDSVTPLTSQNGSTVTDADTFGETGSTVTDADTFQGSNSGGDTTPSQPVTPTTPQTGSQSSGNKTITADEAKKNALAHAGLKAADVTFVKSKLDWEDGRQVYEVEFYTADYREYDYEIDAVTGDVISFDYDAEGYTPPKTGGELTADEAKALALAQVPGAKTSDIREFEVDYDDGRLEYEGKIYYNGMEYEFEIDGYSGAIRSWEAEPIHD